MLPNIVLIAPADETELKLALDFAVELDRPVCIRYPRDAVPALNSKTAVLNQPFKLGKSVTCLENPSSKVAIVCYGTLLYEALKAADSLKAEGIDVDVINARFAKPIDEDLLLPLQAGKTIVTIDDHIISCGFGSALAEFAASKNPDFAASIKMLGVPDNLISCASRSVQLADAGIDANSITKAVKNILSESFSNLPNSSHNKT
jgi:1-deoxy-D-xylulose-5-phosphate synthase